MGRVGEGIVAILGGRREHWHRVDEPEAAIEGHHHNALGVALRHGLGAIRKLVVV